MSVLVVQRASLPRAQSKGKQDQEPLSREFIVQQAACHSHLAPSLSVGRSNIEFFTEFYHLEASSGCTSHSAASLERWRLWVEWVAVVGCPTHLVASVTGFEVGGVWGGCLITR